MFSFVPYRVRNVCLSDEIIIVADSGADAVMAVEVEDDDEPLRKLFVSKARKRWADGPRANVLFETAVGIAPVGSGGGNANDLSLSGDDGFVKLTIGSQ